jgi:hypothetical protein
MSVCPFHGATRPPINGFWRNLIFRFFENLPRRFKFYHNSTKITGTLHEDVFTFMTISCYILLIMRNVLNKLWENQNTHFMFSNSLSENRTVYEMMSKTVEEPEATNEVTVWRTRVACWISKTADTHARTRPRSRAPTQRQICNTYCFSTATMICESASLLRYTDTARLVLHISFLPIQRRRRDS